VPPQGRIIGVFEGDVADHGSTPRSASTSTVFPGRAMSGVK
jgi:hypothetical protein